MTLSAFHDGRSREQLCPHDEDHEDSIEEIACALLNDTTFEQLKVDPGRRLSQIGLTQGNSGMSTPRAIDGDYDDTKDLPQLPALLFNGDDAWAMKTSPVVASKSSSNIMHFSTSIDEPSSSPLNISKYASSHTRKSSAPAIPRRSSKRKSSRSKSNIASPQKPTYGHVRGSASKNKLSKSFSTPLLLNMSATRPSASVSSSVNAQDINGKIAKMLEATQALKGSSSESALLQGPLVPAKKRRLKDNRVLVKVKTAINDRLNSRNAKKAHDSARDDRLLDTPMNDGPEEGNRAVSGLISDVELRLNEGKLLKKAFQSI
jgi:hypothetical protein